jgi:hypothetical protein
MVAKAATKMVVGGKPTAGSAGQKAREGPTKGRHEEVPRELVEEAEKAAKESLESDNEEGEAMKQ